MGRFQLEANPRFAMCESVAASGVSKWHIRAIPIGESPKFGGGITTGCLCGHVKARMGWDLDVAITRLHLAKCVNVECAAMYAVEQERAR